jgi:hypothetical protein
MLPRNDNPYLSNFKFGIDSVFNNVEVKKSNSAPVITNAFLLLDNSHFLLLDGTNFLLLGT